MKKSKPQQACSAGYIKVDRHKCKSCELCIDICPRGLLVLDQSLNRRGLAPVRFSRKGGECSACGLCVQICPECCLTLYK
ncbi:ferredoxin family protein [Candidatus Omnitrophota bacterium]